MFKQTNGWLTEVNGHKVVKKDYGLRYGGAWGNGRPDGVLFHYTAGCGSDIGGTLKSRGISVHFNISREGTIYQYVPLGNVAYHAYDASYHYWGVEHTAFKGSCDLTDTQLEASAALFAGLIEYAKEKKGLTIPLRHEPGPAFTKGFKDHKDGTKTTWNPNVHVDGLYRWSWDKYIREIKSHLMSEEEVDVAYNAFKAGAKKYLRRARDKGKDPGAPPKALEGDAKFGWNLARFAYRNGEKLMAEDDA
jgi:hypothetical protein